MRDPLPTAFLFQAGVNALALLAAGAMACVAARRHGKTAFGILAGTLFLDAALSLLSLIFIAWGLPSGGSWIRFTHAIQIPMRLVSLALTLAAWAMLAFDWKPALPLVSTNTRLNSPGKAGKIAVVLCGLGSLPAAVWACIILFAAGMKSAPTMSEGECLMGSAPALALLLILGAVMIWRKQLGLGTVWMAFAALGALICSGALFLSLMGYLGQP